MSNDVKKTRTRRMAGDSYRDCVFNSENNNCLVQIELGNVKVSIAGKSLRGAKSAAVDLIKKFAAKPPNDSKIYR